MVRQARSRHESTGCARRRLSPTLVPWALLLLALVAGREASASAPRWPPQPHTQPSAPAEQAPEIATLAPGKPIERDLLGGQKHDYQITLAEGQYASVIVEQRGIDLVVRLQEMDGRTIAKFDDESRKQGEEKVEMVAAAAGGYRLSVEASSKSAPAGQYEIRVAEMRAATENDRLLHEARRLKEEYALAFAAGKYEDARRCTERALAISEDVLGKEHPFVAALLNDLAEYYDEKQNFAKAVSLHERALAISEKALGEAHPQTIEIRRLLAWVYFETNEVAKAERLAGRALEASEKTLGPEHYLVGRCLLTLGQVSGDPKRSEQLLQRALAVAEKTVGADHPFAGIALNALGVFYMENGDYRQAEQYLLRSQAVYEKTRGPKNISQAVSLHNLGRIARERKDYAKAEDYYRQAIAIIEQAFGPENPRLAITLNNIANIYRAKGDYAKALETHLRVLRIAEATRGPYHPLTLLSLGNIAKTYAAQGSIAEAIKFQARVDAVIERNIELNLAIGSERQKLSYLNAVAERTDRTISLNADLAPHDGAASALAALVLLQRKGRVLDAMSESFASLRQRSTAEEQALIDQYNSTTAQLARLVLNGPQSMPVEEHQRKISELEEQKGRLEDDISHRSAEFRAGSQPVTLAAVQAAIPANAALIEFAVYRPFDPKAESNSEAYQEPRYIAYVLRQKGEVCWRDLGDAKTIDAAISSLRRALGDPSRRDVQERSRAVDQRVMQPVRGLIGDAQHLLVSPDGALNLIPFEALVDEQGRYLIQRYSFTYLTSGRDLLRLQVARTGSHRPLVVADPLFGEPEWPALTKAAGMNAPSRAQKRQGMTSATDLASVYFAPLPGTAREAQAIKSLFPEASILLGQQATESALKVAGAPRLVHIATHGFFLTGDTSAAAGTAGQTTRAISTQAQIDNPLLRSGLALAGANLHTQHREPRHDDGILTAMEASGLNLWGTRLVVLSACDTGLGEVRAGEGVYGLRRAFVLAGAETLVMSLWGVSDAVTREMMVGYYAGLKRGLGRGEALRQVQLRMLKRAGREHPFYWGSFIQTGEWAALDGRR
jgi:CHAT domain-containing protein/Tfp pilus assembly protein PilF